ncbi:MAG: M14 family metallocarboxypeptidase [Verrucomicrobia bacterium]|nr:M14 family metallocarboxypeptidase [Verrucomicrobiota bacterium]
MSDAFDWDSFQPAFAIEAQRHGFLREDLLQTGAGALSAWTRADPGPVVYLSAGIHGDEPAGPLALLAWLRAGGCRAGVHWRICPALNPHGLAIGARGNAAGADLNRDYRTRMTDEISAHAAWLERGPLPALFVSLHEDWEAQGFYLYEINLGEDDPLQAERILSAVDPWFPRHGGDDIDGHVPRAPGWIFHEAEPDLADGWPEAIHLAKLGCPLSFTFETPSGAALSDRVGALEAALQTTLRFLPEGRCD